MPEVPVSVKIKVGVTGVAEKEKLIKNLEKLGDTATKTSKKTEDSLKAITPTMQSLWQQADKLAQHWGVAFQSALPYVKKLGDSFKANTTDTYQLAQAADFVSKKFKVSFGETYNTLKRMGVGFEGVSHDVDKTAKAATKFASDWGVSFKDAFNYQLKLGTGVSSSFDSISKAQDKVARVAQVFSQNWGISFKDAYTHVSKLGIGVKKSASDIKNSFDSMSKAQDKNVKIAQTFAQNWGVSFKDAYNHVSKLGVGMKNTEGQIKTSSRGIGYQLTFVAWHFRYLGNIFDRISKSIIRGIKDVISVSAELQESFLSIRTATALYGQDSEKATQIVKDLALTGLLPLKEAANSVKNLMITGLGVPEMEKFAYRYLDVAFLMTSGMDEMQKSLETISESILRGTTVLSADVTAKTLWTTTEKRLQRTMDKSLKDLSARQRALEILKTIEDKYAATLDLHKIEANTTRGAINRLTVSFELMKNALGIALLPLLNAVSDAFIKLSSYVEALIKVLGPTIPVMVAVGLAIAFVTSKLAVTIGIFLSFFQIMRQLSVMTGMAAISMWKIYLPLLAVGALVGGGVYLFLKYSGALDKAKQSAANIEEQFKKLQETITGINKSTEESIGIDDDRRISHERTVADIEEDLERERSKGLWANQMSIKDLEKRLSRENKDWDRYLKELGDKDVEDPTAGLGGMFGEILSDANKTAEELGKIDWFKGLFEGLKDPDRWAKVRNIILGFTDEIKNTVSDPNFWRFFGEELARNIGNIITGIGDTIKAAFEGLFGSVMRGVATVAALTFVTVFGVSLLKHFSAGGVGFLAATSAGLGVKAALLAAIPATLAITVTLLSAGALYEAIKFRQQIDAIWNSVDNLIDSSNDLMSLYITKFREGKMSAEEFKQKTDALNRSALETINYAKEASWSWKSFFTGEYLWGGIKNLFDFQTGGIVPGMRNQAVPIIAHGGERVIPAGEVGGGGNITVNINSPVVRSQEDINSIARAVSNVLGQRQKFSRLGAF